MKQIIITLMKFDNETSLVETSMEVGCHFMKQACWIFILSILSKGNPKIYIHLYIF